jgi:hypothetical protein
MFIVYDENTWDRLTRHVSPLSSNFPVNGDASASNGSGSISIVSDPTLPRGDVEAVCSQRET